MTSHPITSLTHDAVLSSPSDRSRQVVSSRLAFLIPVLLAGIYPWLILALGYSILSFRAPANTPTQPAPLAALVLGLAAVYAVPVIAFWYGQTLGGIDHPTSRQLGGRGVAHLAFAAPSLLVAIGNFAGILHRRSAVPAVWVGLWTCIGVYLLFRPESRPRPFAYPSSIAGALRTAHGVMAALLLAVFLLPHLSNHLSGFWSPDAHLQLMAMFRRVYRAQLIEPAVVGLLVLQMGTGLYLLRRRLKTRVASIYDTLQTMSGAYLGVFLTSHMTAAFSARWSGVDTNWHWLTNNGATMLGNSPNVALLPHYFLGPVMVAVHVACGLRSVLEQHEVSKQIVDRIAGGLIACGAAVSVAITAGLLGVHIGR